MEKRRLKLAQKQVQAMMGLLSLQFIIGVLLTTIIDYNPNKTTAVQTTFLILHIIVAAALFAISLVRVITGYKWRIAPTQALIGFVAIISALVSGGVAAANGNSVAVFMMAIGILIAFSSTGQSTGVIARQMSVQKK